MKLWICGKYRSGEFPNVVWDFQGIFLTKKKALNACREKNDFIAPVVLNKELPQEEEIMPGVEYPLI